MVVDPKEVNQMKNLIAVMNGKKPEPFQPSMPPLEPELQETFAPGVMTKKDIQGMKMILEKFHKVANKGIQNLMEDSKTDSELHEALMTKPMKDGVQIGIWQIKANKFLTPNGQPKSTYDIVSAVDDQVISENLCLYETAYAIVKQLNKGVSPLSKSIREVLNLEEKYLQFKNDAVRFKSKAVRCLKEGDSRSNAIFEGRYSDHRDKALMILRKIKELTRNV